MTALPFSDDTLALNPELRDKKARPVGKRNNADKSHLFLDAWEQHAPAWRKKYAVPEPECVFAPPRKFRFDWCFVVQGVAVEVDGGQWSGPNGGRHNSDKDREKMNLAAVSGYRVMHFTPRQLRQDPAGCVALVVKALEFDEA